MKRAACAGSGAAAKTRAPWTGLPALSRMMPAMAPCVDAFEMIIWTLRVFVSLVRISTVFCPFQVWPLIPALAVTVWMTELGPVGSGTLGRRKVPNWVVRVDWLPVLTVAPTMAEPVRSVTVPDSVVVPGVGGGLLLLDEPPPPQPARPRIRSRAAMLKA